MKKTILALLVAIGFSLSINAQSTYKEEVDAVQAIFGKEKKELIIGLIKMTPEENAKFWPVYDAYEIERKSIGQERMKMLQSLSDAYQQMTPEKADMVTMQAIRISNQSDRMLEKYYTNMKKAVNPEVAFEFYQAEVYILTAVRASLMEQIPLYSTVKPKK